jgi:DNA polymerase
MDPELKFELLKALEEEYENCTQCELSAPAGRKRQNVVFGEGNHNARLMVIGEAPGKSEDFEGFPFVGLSGQLLNKFLASFNCSREEIYVCNVVMCRPTASDNPKKNVPPPADAVVACLPRLQRVIEIVDPFVILILGDTVLKTLTNERRSITSLARDESIPRIEVVVQGVCTEVKRAGFVTFHPSYLLRNDSTQENSDMHRAYLTFEKAISTADMYAHLYYGDSLPGREVEEYDEAD